MTFDAEREAVVQQLCRDFANDRLTTQELDTRLEAAYGATTSDELRALIARSAPAGAAIAPTESQLAHTEPAGTGAGLRSPRPQRQPLRLSAMFASVRKKGDWEPSPVMHASATFGEVVIDFREARIGAGVTVVHASATLGTVRIIVPPGLHVECDGSATFGEFREEVSMTASPGTEAPTLRITGHALFAEVKVVTRFPGETEREARRRLKRRR